MTQGENQDRIRRIANEAKNEKENERNEGDDSEKSVLRDSSLRCFYSCLSLSFGILFLYPCSFLLLFGYEIKRSLFVTHKT